MSCHWNCPTKAFYQGDRVKVDLYFSLSLTCSLYMVFVCFATDPTPERDKSPDPGRDSVSPVPEMDGKRLRLSLHSPVLAPLNRPIVPVRVSHTSSRLTMNT